MAAASLAKRSAVEEGDDGAATEDDDAGVFQDARVSDRCIGESFGTTLGSEPPKGDFVEVARCVMKEALPRQYRCGGQRGACEMAARPVGRKEASAVVVEEREVAAVADDGREKLGHTGETFAIGCRHVVEHGVKREHVERIKLVIGGLLEVAAVGFDAIVHMAANDVAPESAPAGSAGRLRKQPADFVQCDGLSQEVRVWGEVNRQIVLEVQSVAVEFGKEALTKRGGHFRADEVPDPDP